ncbi:IS110 family transposase [Streptosporangium canum]|uniref:IS110 family transposase n=1 Tax=Streptosporangium canum TaxID=324952 RepID=UPI00342CB036
MLETGETLRLFVGDDWAEAHHDVELMDASGRRLAKARLPEGVAGMTRLHAMIGEHLGDDGEEAQVLVGIETDRGPWVRALVAAGYTVYAVNPLQTARYRERLAVSGAKSDAADAHMLADMVRTDSHQLRPVAGDSQQGEAIKVVTRTHKTLIWDRTRHTQRLRHALRDYFPAALAAFDDLAAREALELLAKAPDPAAAAKLTVNQITTVLKRVGCRGDLTGRATRIQAALRSEHLGQPPVVTAAYAASTRALVTILATLNEQIAILRKEVEAHFGRHPAAEIITSQPGLGPILGARVLAEFGDDPDRYTSAKARKNYAGTSPITRASGKKRVVAARFVHNDRLIDALITQAAAAVRFSPGARAYYDKQRARDADYNTALRQVANRLVGILHGCLKTGTLYDEATAWSSHPESLAA